MWPTSAPTASVRELAQVLPQIPAEPHPPHDRARDGPHRPAVAPPLPWGRGPTSWRDSTARSCIVFFRTACETHVRTAGALSRASLCQPLPFPPPVLKFGRRVDCDRIGKPVAPFGGASCQSRVLFGLKPSAPTPSDGPVRSARHGVSYYERILRRWPSCGGAMPCRHGVPAQSRPSRADR